MGRPPFTLSDHDARRLVAEVTRIGELFPIDRRDHRPFVRAFIAAIHAITGRTYSPAIYRRLLMAYAPDRKPSTATLALEKEQFMATLAMDDGPIPMKPDESPGAPGLRALVDEMRRLVQAASVRPPGDATSYLMVQCEFLQRRLSDTERALHEAKAISAQLTAELQLARAVAQRDRQQIESVGADTAEMAGAIAKMAAAIEDMRLFSMRAIDEARGETRAWRERCQHAETQLKEQIAMTEHYRRQAYRQAPSPSGQDRKA